jgi:beta-N-acetylhexosaminidase
MRLNVLRLFGFGFDGVEVPADIRALLARGLGAVILFKRNLVSLEQVCRLTADLRRAASDPLLIGVDQEGGRVIRLPAPFLAPPAAAILGRLEDPELTADVARAVGRELLAAGMNWNLAPVLDVHTNPANPIIGDRAFGSDPDRVTRMGLAALRGFASAGVLATAKHFPGHGDTVTDSHLTLPQSSQSASRWRTVEFLPFLAAIKAGVPSIMVAHLQCPALDALVPTSLSRIVISDVLRSELGFKGAVVSDDMEMGAIAAKFDIGEAAVRFLEAGGDLILVCRNSALQQAAVAGVESALRSGRISEARIQESEQRITAAQATARTPEGVDVELARKIVGMAGAELLPEIQRRQC